MRIGGQRKDLRGVRNAPAQRALKIEGRGVQSLEGIEEFSSLEQLQLEHVRHHDLGRLQHLATLRLLAIIGSAPGTDYEPVTQLTTLQTLMLVDVADEDAVTVAGLSFAGMRNLKTLHMATRASASAAPTTTDLAWWPLPQLEQLSISGLSLTPTAIKRLEEHSASLRRLTYAPVDAQQLQRVTVAMPNVEVAVLGDVAAPRLGVIHAFDDGRRRLFSVGIDLAERLGVATNVEAEAYLRDALAVELDDESLVSFDTESSAVWLVSEDEGNLRRAFDVARRMDRGRVDARDDEPWSDAELAAFDAEDDARSFGSPTDASGSHREPPDDDEIFASGS